MLKIVVPKGSLEEATFKLFEQADLPIKRSSNRGYKLQINDPRVTEAMMLRPQEIPKYIEEGEFDIGTTGYDWIIETEAIVKEVADLQFSKQGWRKVKIILATDNNNPINNVSEIKANSRIVTEYPRLTRRYFKRINKGKVSIRDSCGATEAKVPRLADYLVDVTETGETLRQNNKKILDVILESSTKLIANIESWNNPLKKQAIKELCSLLVGTIMANDKTLIKMNISEKNIQKIVKYTPSLRAPTISSLFLNNNNPERWFMLETVVQKLDLNIIIPKIKAFGAIDILEINISKIIP